MREQTGNSAIQITFWGVRGSGAAAGKDFLVYGGNSCCVSAETAGSLFIFDAGTGIGNLGKYVKETGYSGEIHLFLSHLHLDHIHGLPLFSPIFQSDIRLHIYGTADTAGSLRERLNLVLGPPYWPVSPEQYRAEMVWHDLEEKDGGIAVSGDGWKIKALSAMHPNGGLIYRLETADGSFVYGLDCEMPESYQEQFVEFSKDTDLLIFDGTYDDSEYPAVAGYGHGTWQQAAEMKQRTGARRVLVSHHKWERTDAELEELERLLSGQEPGAAFAKEGMRVKVP